jgi:lactam utilization protein B
VDRLADVVSSTNIACGFHAGDPDMMRRTRAHAARNGVAVGAQVSYRDLAGFGRRYLAVSGDTLTNDLLYEIGALDAFGRWSRRVFRSCHCPRWLPDHRPAHRRSGSNQWVSPTG